MALLDALPGVSVTILVDGQPAQEYQPPADDDIPAEYPAGKTIMCYIESKSDANFAIVWDSRPYIRLGNECKNLAFDIFVDGKCTEKVLIRQDRLLAGYKGTLEGPTTIDSRGVAFRRKYKFTEILTVNDATESKIKEDISNAKSLGDIVCKVWRRGEMINIKPSRNRVEDLERQQISEKALKGRAISHGTLYSAPQRLASQSLNVYSTTKLDQQPFAVFIFRYRSLESLRKEMIIPRPATPEPYDQLSEAGRRRIIREHLAGASGSEDNTDAKVKQETKDEDIRQDFKQEKKRKLCSADELEMLDLTDDTPGVKHEWTKVKKVKKGDGKEQDPFVLD